MFNKLKTIRKQKHITCEIMASVLGLKTRGGYLKKENGTVPLSLTEAKAISDFFDMSIDDIFFENEVS